MVLSPILKGVIYFLISIGLIAVVDTTCKFYTEELNAVVLVWGYFIGIMIFVFGYFIARGQIYFLKTDRLVAQIVRPGFLVLSITGLFVGLTYLPLAEATAIGFTGPLFITALSVPIGGVGRSGLPFSTRSSATPSRSGWIRWSSRRTLRLSTER